ncbi:Maf family protein, partial [Acinetobacter baumannii]
SRKAMLAAAGVPFEARAADVDEGAIKRELIGVPGCEVATILAEAKALAVSVASPGRLVLGGDSLVEVAGRLFDKPRS